MRKQPIFFVPLVIATAGLLLAAPAEDNAQRAAEEWLALVDKAEFAESWKTAAQVFKDAVSEEEWVRSVGSVRKPIGSLISRALKGAEYTRSIPGGADGEYVILRFESSFENKAEAVETITATLEKDGLWRVSCYFVK